MAAEYKEEDYSKYNNKDKSTMAKSTTMYTYILKDTELDLFKIGKTRSPIARFRSLCRHGKVYPIALLSKDVEKQLHDMYKDNRVVHTGYKGNGGTEWFKRGGVFDEFIATVDTGKQIPYISVYGMVEHMLEHSIIIVENQSLLWELAQTDLGYYFMGLAILGLVGAMGVGGKNPFAKERHKDHIMIIKRKIALSDVIVDMLGKHNRFYLTGSMQSEFIKDVGLEGADAVRVRFGEKSLVSSLHLVRKRVLSK